MLYVRSEGGFLKNGFNFYPWSERKRSIGFVFKWNDLNVYCRYSVLAKKLFIQKYRCESFVKCSVSPNEAQKVVDAKNLDELEHCIELDVENSD